jgi:hypothetical protein
VLAGREAPTSYTIVEQDAVLVNCGLHSKSLEVAENHSSTALTGLINATECHTHTIHRFATQGYQRHINPTDTT